MNPLSPSHCEVKPHPRGQHAAVAPNSSFSSWMGLKHLRRLCVKWSGCDARPGGKHPLEWRGATRAHHSPTGRGDGNPFVLARWVIWIWRCSSRAVGPKSVRREWIRRSCPRKSCVLSRREHRVYPQRHQRDGLSSWGRRQLMDPYSEYVRGGEGGFYSLY